MTCCCVYVVGFGPTVSTPLAWHACSFLNQATDGLRKDDVHGSGALGSSGNATRLPSSSVPSRLYTLSNGRSLEVAGSLDLSWLDGHLQPSPTMQRQASAAEAIMGPERLPAADLPSPPALLLRHPRVNFDPHGVNHVQHSHAPSETRTADLGWHSNATTAPNVHNQVFPSGGGAGLPSSPFVQTASRHRKRKASVANEPQPRMHFGPEDDVMQDARPKSGLMHMEDASNAAILMNGASASATHAQAGFVPVTPPQPASSHEFTGNGAASFLLPTLYGGLPPHPSAATSGSLSSRVDAMAQWAQERALMQALSSSDASAAVQAMAACGVTRQQNGPQQSCPFQVRMSRQPLVCVAPSSPVKLAATPQSPSGRDH
jgi:hypothetical protein